RRIELAAELKRCSGSPSGAPEIFADFSSGGYAPWTATGEAFGSGPAHPLDWAFGPRDSSAAKILLASAAHSGIVSARLHGAIRSPTFEITRPKICYRLYGDGGQVRLIVDSLQFIRDPIYGGLKFGPGGREPAWHVQDVSKWIGHRAYIEVIDDG